MSTCRLALLMPLSRLLTLAGLPDSHLPEDAAQQLTQLLYRHCRPTLSATGLTSRLHILLPMPAVPRAAHLLSSSLLLLKFYLHALSMSTSLFALLMPLSRLLTL